MANKIYVWEGIPDENSDPKFTLEGQKPMRLSSDGDYLVAICDTGPGWSLGFYRVADLANQAQPVMVDSSKSGLNLPQKALASHGHLFVGNTGDSRLHIWSKIENALSGQKADIILGETDAEDRRPEIGKDKLFWPAIPAFDGSYLWVGEFKFSGRLFRFSVR